MHKTSMAKAISGVLLLAASLSANAQAQYPTRPVRIIDPGPGGLDLIARKFFPMVAEGLGQPIVIENKTPGVIPGQTVAASAPDGYTLLFTGGTHWLAPLTQLDVSYDPVKDFAAVAVIYIQPYVLAVNNKVTASSVKELIALAKQRPGQLNMGASTPGSSSTLSGTLFRELSGADIVAVPYKTGNARAAALLSGEIEMDFISGSESVSFTKSGKTKALAVTSRRPSANFPGLPTVAETLPDYEYGSTTMLFAPAKTPLQVVTRLNQEVNKVLKNPEAVKILAGFTADPMGGTPEDAANFLKRELTRMDKLLKSVGIKPQ